MGNLMFFAAFLYKKLRDADREKRDKLRPFLRDVQESGAIPLGMRPDADGDAYWWVVYEPARFASAEAMERSLRARTPPGVRMVVVTL